MASSRGEEIMGGQVDVLVVDDDQCGGCHGAPTESKSPTSSGERWGAMATTVARLGADRKGSCGTIRNILAQNRGDQVWICRPVSSVEGGGNGD